MSEDRDRRYLEALGRVASDSIERSARAEPVLFSTRAALGQSIAGARQLARLSRADLARALGTTEQHVADIESGSAPITRTT